MERNVVLVTGGNGCLGQHVIKCLHLQAKNVTEIRVLDLVEFNKKLEYRETKPIKLYVGSITDSELVTKACDGVDTVIHIASLIDWRLFPDSKKLHDINVKGTETVVQACKDQNVPNLIYCSSLSVFYGPQEYSDATETSIKSQKRLYFGAYAGTKLKAQNIVLNSNGTRLKNNKTLCTVAILPLPLYGELDYLNITAILKPFVNKTYTLIGPMTAHVHYSYVGNCAYMFIKAMEAMQQNPEVGGEYFFAADDTPHDTFPGTVKPFFDKFNIKTTSYHVPLCIIMTFMFFVYCFLYIVRFFRTVDATNLGFTTGSISFLNTTCYVTYDKAKTLLDYKPPYNYKTSIELSNRFYAKAVTPR